MKKIIFILSLLLGKINFTYAQVTSPGGMLKDAGDAAKLTNPNLPDVVGGIINSVLGILGTVFLVLIIYAGFTWMTAGGNEEKIQKAQKIIRNSTIGLLVVALAFAITQFVLRTLIEAGV